MGTSVENNFLNIHPKIQQLQKKHNWIFTYNTWRKSCLCNNWKVPGMHNHRNWWTDTRVINLVTKRNVRRFLAWNSSTGNVGTPPGCSFRKFTWCSTWIRTFEYRGHWFLCLQIHHFYLLPYWISIFLPFYESDVNLFIQYIFCSMIGMPFHWSS